MCTTGFAFWRRPRFEESLLITDFKANAICAAGYKGNATVSKCSLPQEPYTLSGCTPIKCTEPSDTAAYDLIVYSAEVLSSQKLLRSGCFWLFVNVPCCLDAQSPRCRHSASRPSARMVSELPKQRHALKKDSLLSWKVVPPFAPLPRRLLRMDTLCFLPFFWKMLLFVTRLVNAELRKECKTALALWRRPRFEDSLLMSDFKAHAVCAAGYTGTAAVSKCATPNEPYTLSGCTPIKCTEPNNTAAYDLTVYSVEVLRNGLGVRNACVRVASGSW